MSLSPRGAPRNASPTLSHLRGPDHRRSVTPKMRGLSRRSPERLAGIGFSLERIDSGETCNLWARRGDRPFSASRTHRRRPDRSTGAVAIGSFEPRRTRRHALRARCGGHENLAGRVRDRDRSLRRDIRPSEVDRLLLTSRMRRCPGWDHQGRRTLASRDERLDYCIVGDPRPSAAPGRHDQNDRRGSLSGRLTVRACGRISLARNPDPRSCSPPWPN